MHSECTEEEEEEEEEDEDEVAEKKKNFREFVVGDLCKKWWMNICALFMQWDIRCDGS